MSANIELRLAALRGSIAAEEPGARGIERVARNPECMRLRALTIAGITPSTAAVQIYKGSAREGQSPFALGVGTQFEQNLFAGGAAKLLDLYRDAGRLSLKECKVAIIPDIAPLPTAPAKLAAALARRRTESDRLLKMKLNGHPQAPNLIIKPRLVVNLLGIGHAIEPDALVGADADPFYRPVEIKSYPDRRGKTDPADIRSACRQAAVGVIALRHFVQQLGLKKAEQIVPAAGDLVLRVTGSMSASLNAMGVRAEVASLERAIGEAPSNLDELEAMLPQGAALDQPSVLDGIPASYRASCREHCALAGKCKEQAIAAQEPVILGDNARELLAPAGTVSRALDLMNRRGAGPRTTEEQLLAEQLQRGLAAYRRAV